MEAENVSLDFLARQAMHNADELRHVRREIAELTKLVVAGYELTRRVERRQSELRDDIEVTIKMELGGAMAHLQTSLVGTLATIEQPDESLAGRVDALERKP